MKVLFFVFLFSFVAGKSHGVTRTEFGSKVNISTNLLVYELLQTKYKDIYLDLTNISRQESLQMWFTLYVEDEDNKKHLRRINKVRSQVRISENYEKLIYYYSVTGQFENALKAVELYFLKGFSMLHSLKKSPHHNSVLKSILYSDFDYEKSWIEDLNFLSSCIEDRYLSKSKNSQYYNPSNGKIFVESMHRCIRNYKWSKRIAYVLRVLIRRKKYRGALMPISALGLVQGNSVDIHSYTPHEAEAVQSLGDSLGEFFGSTHASGLLLSEASVEEMKSVMSDPSSAIKDFFVNSELGPFLSSSHPSFQEGPTDTFGNNIYSKVLSSIEDAKESIFIDVFWIGGSIGVVLAKALLRKVRDNKNFKVYIITDDKNKFSYGPELDPVYNYLRAFAERFPEYGLYIAPAQIELKRTALPEFVDLFFTDNVVANVHSRSAFQSFLERSGIQLLGKSDHSKVFVVDGLNEKSGVAFVGSKNWTDSSGGVAIDEVAEIRGPAVPVILNAFYYDVYEAFLLDQQSGRQLVPLHSKERGYPHLQHENNIKKLLSGMDVLERFKGGDKFLLSKTMPIEKIALGTDQISPAQNNVYGTEVSAIEQNIQLILAAKTQIIIDDQFLYDPRVFEALKIALHSHQVNVFIVLHPLTTPGKTDTHWAHIPNNLFIPTLVDLGAKVKWKIFDKNQETAILDVKNRFGFEVSPEFHPKSFSIDGVLFKDRSLVCDQKQDFDRKGRIPSLVTGSANKDILTMSGGFREFQVQIVGDSAVIAHDCRFWVRWDDPYDTVETNGLDFTLPKEITEAGFKEKEKILSGIRMLFFSLYNFSKEFY